MNGEGVEYTTIKIPRGLADVIDEFRVSHKEFSSRTDVVKQAVRIYIDSKTKLEKNQEQTA